MGSQPCSVFDCNITRFIGVRLDPSVQQIPPDFSLVCAETFAKSYRSVRGDAHPVCLFNVRVASSWKLRNLVLVWRSRCQGSKW